MGWSFGAEGRDQDVTPRLHGSPDRGDVAPPVLFVAEEVEHGPIVREVETMGRQLGLCDISDEPTNRSGSVAQSRPGQVQRL